MDPMGTNILQVPLLHPFVQRFWHRQGLHQPDWQSTVRDLRAEKYMEDPGSPGKSLPPFEQCSFHPGWLFDIGKYTTQLYRDYNNPSV